MGVDSTLLNVKWSSYQLQRPLYHFQPRGQGHAEVCGRNQWAGDNKYFDRCFFTIMMSSCENVIRVSTYDIHFEFQRWHWKWEKSFELLPNENFLQFRVANPGSSSSSDSSLKLRFLFAQSLDISCKTGRRIFPPFLSSVSALKFMILSNNFPFSLPGQAGFFNHLSFTISSYKMESQTLLEDVFQVGTNWSAGHYLQC